MSAQPTVDGRNTFAINFSLVSNAAHLDFGLVLGGSTFSADGAYDRKSVYDAIEAHGIDRRTRVPIPPS